MTPGPRRESYARETLGCVLWVILLAWLFSTGTAARLAESVRDYVEEKMENRDAL